MARWHWPGPSGGPRSAAQARELLLASISLQAAGGFTLWLWRERSSGELVARVGLAPAVVEGAAVVEVGWSVPGSRQGRGYATEAARASIRFGFEECGLGEIVSFTMVENAASRRVMEKAGLAYRREFEHAGLPHVLYAKKKASPSTT